MGRDKIPSNQTTFITVAAGKVMFSLPLVSLFVGLFVGLSVNNIAGKRVNGFSWNFQDRTGMTHGTFWNNLVMFHLTPWTLDLFLALFWGMRVCYHYCGKTDECIFMNFSGKVSLKTRNNLQHFCHVAVNPLNPGLIFLFPGFAFLGDIMEKRVNGFSLYFQDMSRTPQKIIWYTVSRLNRLFHALPFTRCGVSVTTITVKRFNQTSWNFQHMSAMVQGTFWNIFRLMRLTPWIQDIFYYLGASTVCAAQ